MKTTFFFGPLSRAVAHAKSALPIDYVVYPHELELPL
jgi:hypothetical protein